MDYSTLSDFEINSRVAEILHPDLEVIESKSRPPCACVTGQLPSQWVDYCNNPTDAWPIIANNKIGLNWYESDGEWTACGDYAMSSGCWDWDCTPEHYCGDSNPLRAAMIVFLMMQDKANANS